MLIIKIIHILKQGSTIKFETSRCPPASPVICLPSRRQSFSVSKSTSSQSISHIFHKYIIFLPTYRLHQLGPHLSFGMPE